MPRERTHYDGCWQAHDECVRTVLDGAAEALALTRHDPASDGRGWFESVGEREELYHDAAVVLRVAEARLRVLSADIRADQWPTSGERVAAEAAVDRAADMLTDGMDDEGAGDATV